MRLNEENALLIKAKKNYGTYDVSGKSFKVNQLVQNGNFVDKSVWSAGACSYSVNSNTATIVPNAIHSSFRQAITITNNHKIFYCFDIKYTLGETYIPNFFNIQTVRTGTGNWEHIETIITPTNTNGFISIYDYDNDIRSTWYLKNVMVIDLTTLFGAGNEPTTLSQFYATPQGQFLKKVGYIPYTLGKIIDSQSQYEFSGRNLYDKTNQTLMHTSNFISVLPNTTYRCLYDGDIANGCYWNEYDISKNTIIIGTDSNPNHTYNSKNFTFTTGANTYFVKIHLYFSVVRTNEQWLAIYNSMQLQLSTETETSYTPYFKPRKLLAQLPNGRDEHYSRNVFDGELEGNGIDQASGISTPSANAFRSKNYINVVSGQYYTFGWNTTLSPTEIYLFEYDSNKTFIRKLTFYSSNTSKLLSANTQYVRFCFIKGGSGWATNVPSKETAQILLQLSTETDTSYIPHIVNANYQELEYIESSGTRYTKTYQYVPCYRKLDLAIGLYDLTNDTFTAYSGTKGREIRHTNEIIKLGSLLGKQDTITTLTPQSSSTWYYVSKLGISFTAQTSANYFNFSLIDGHKYFININADTQLSNISVGAKTGSSYPSRSGTCINSGKNNYLIFTWYNTASVDLLYLVLNTANQITINNLVLCDLTQLGLDTLTAQQFYEQYHDYLPLLASGLPPIYKPVIKLLSAGTAHDVYRNTSGKITENIGVVDLGTLSWSKNGNNQFYSSGIGSLIKKPANDNTQANVFNSLYITDTLNRVFSKQSDKIIGIYSSSGIMLIWDSSKESMSASDFKTAMSGIYLYYERNSSLTETLMQKIESVDLSTINWSGSGGNYYANASSFGIKLPTSSDEKVNGYCDKYAIDTSYNASHFTNDKTIGVATNGYIYLKDTSISQTSDIKGTFTFVSTQTEPIPSIMLPTNATKCVDNNGVEMGMVKR